MAKFTVDTQLFRELGQLLVGRDSTALVELIKNAYDADGTTATVHGEGLRTGMGFISVTDDGIGMTPDVFEQGFLRIASRTKTEDRRRSPKFGRKYTGRKGIGRLAAHKLSRELVVRSTPDPEVYGSQVEGVSASIDWDEIERHESLDDVGQGVRTESVTGMSRPGTTIELRRLRSAWTEGSLARFVGEVQSFEASSFLTDPLPKTVVASDLLFSSPHVRDSMKRDKGFTVMLSGDFDVSEDFWHELAERAQWIVEVRAHEGESDVQYAVCPTKSEALATAGAERRIWSYPHPDPKNGPFFTARILVRSTRRVPRSLRPFAQASNGVRIYREGFRVLPYGQRGDDWLELDADYTRRREPFELGGLQGDELEEPVEGETLYRLANSSYYGGVFLTEAGAPYLEPLINREGFVPGESFRQLRDLIRRGIDLSVRARAAAAANRPSTQRGSIESPGTGDAPRKQQPIDEGLEAAINTIKQLTERTEDLGGQGDELGDRLRDAAGSVQTARELLESSRTEKAQLRVAASVGTQFAAFIHEMTALLAQTRVIGELSSRLAADPTLSRSARGTVGVMREAIGELMQNLERQVSFLTDVVGGDAQRRRRRLPLEARIAAAAQLLSSRLDQSEQTLDIKVDPALKTPPMFSSELLGVLINVLSNAIKAAGAAGRILVRAHESDSHLVLTVANSGESVDLHDAERWFQPFESTTSEVDEVLGQGMGLGLPIVRRVLDEYGGEAAFVEPERGFATQLEILVPLRRRGK